MTDIDECTINDQERDRLVKLLREIAKGETYGLEEYKDLAESMADRFEGMPIVEEGQDETNSSAQVTRRMSG